MCVNTASTSPGTSSPASVPHTESHATHPPAFFSNWSKVALDESKHFSLLVSRLSDAGVKYGSMPVHAALWESARVTRNSLRAGAGRKPVDDRPVQACGGRRGYAGIGGHPCRWGDARRCWPPVVCLVLHAGRGGACVNFPGGGEAALGGGHQMAVQRV